MTSPVTSRLSPICLAPPLPPKRRKVHKLHLCHPPEIKLTSYRSYLVTCTPPNQETQNLRVKLEQALEGVWVNNPIYKPKN